MDVEMVQGEQTKLKQFATSTSIHGLTDEDVRKIKMKIIKGLVEGLVVLLTVFFTNARKGVTFVVIVLAVCLFAPCKAQANPRSPLPQIPELIWPLYYETFDEVYDVYSYAVTNAQVTLGNYTFIESWSGYALERSGATIRS